jgi:hypothetical protein
MAGDGAEQLVGFRGQFDIDETLGAGKEVRSCRMVAVSYREVVHLAALVLKRDADAAGGRGEIFGAVVKVERGDLKLGAVGLLARTGRCWNDVGRTPVVRAASKRQERRRA